MLNKVICYISKVGSETIDLPLYIKSQIDSVNSESLKEQKLTAYSLLYKGAKRIFNIDLGEDKFFINEHGKPLHKKFAFSITHTKNVVAVAFSMQNVGVDIEKLSRFDKFKLPSIMGLAYHLSKKTYCLEWTKKEACFKINGGAVFSPAKIDTSKYITKTKEIVLDGESYYLTLAKDVDFTATYITNDNEINSEIVNL